MRWRICLFLAVAMLVSACGFERQSVAVINWQKAMEAHPRFIRLKDTGEKMEKAMRLRDQQALMGEKQLELMEKLTKMKQTSQGNYMQAEYMTRVSARDAVEREKLRDLEERLMKKAEPAVAEDRKQIEEAYRLPILNLKLKLQNVRMTPQARAELTKELEQVMASRDRDMGYLDMKKRALISNDMKPAIEGYQKRMTAFAKQVQEELLQKSLGLKAQDAERLQQGPKELEKLLASMDKQIGLQQQGYNKLRQDITEDIRNALKKITASKNYEIVIADPRGVGKATDITDAVCAELKKLAN